MPSVFAVADQFVCRLRQTMEIAYHGDREAAQRNIFDQLAQLRNADQDTYTKIQLRVYPELESLGITLEPQRKLQWESDFRRELALYSKSLVSMSMFDENSSFAATAAAVTVLGGVAVESALTGHFVAAAGAYEPIGTHLIGMGVDGVSQGVVAACLIVRDLIKYNKGQLEGKAFAARCTEHVAGGVGGTCGGYAGGAAGFAVGALAGPVGATVGAIIGTLLGAVFGHCAARCATKSLLEWLMEQSPYDLAKLAAKQITFKDHEGHVRSIDIDSDDFRTARNKFHKAMVQVHPDRAGPDEAERKSRTAKAQALNASWQVVREYYNSAQVRLEEGLFKYFVRKERKSPSDSWTIKNAWLEDASDSNRNHVANSETVMVEEVINFM